MFISIKPFPEQELSFQSFISGEPIFLIIVR